MSLLYPHSNGVAHSFPYPLAQLPIFPRHATGFAGKKTGEIGVLNIAGMVGCPAKEGMGELSKPAHFACYWLKRPMGLIILVIAGIVIYMLVKK